MKTMRCLAILIAILLSFQGMGLAKLVSGKILSVADGSFEVKRVNPVTGGEEVVKISVNDNTFFTGVNSLKELKADDPVWVDVMPDATPGTWKATSVRKA